MIKIEKEKFKEWSDLHNTGKSLTQISKECGVNYRTLYYGLKREGYQVTINLDDKRQTIPTEDYFENIQTEQQAYILGLLMADGCIIKRDKVNRVQLKLVKSDSKLVEEVRDILMPDRKLYDCNSVLRGKQCTSTSLIIPSNKMVADLQKLGLQYNKTLEGKTFVELGENTRHFIRGFFDGDGSVSLNAKNKAQIYICAVDKTFIEQLNTWLISNKIVTSVYEEERPGQNMYKVAIRHESRSAFFDMLYKNATLKLERKYNKYANIVVIRGYKTHLTP
jgi:intein-encoded DNA endonuclease-like protein